MNTFQIKPQISLLDQAVDFTAAFPVTKKDLIFTSRRVYQNYFCGKFKNARRKSGRTRFMFTRCTWKISRFIHRNESREE